MTRQAARFIDIANTQLFSEAILAEFYFIS